MNEYDVIVVGAGAAGGLAASRLSAAGLRVLVLDAGWKASYFETPFRRLSADLIGYVANPKSLRFLPHNLVWKGRQALKLVGSVRQPVQTKCYAWERDPAAFVDDKDCPYEVAPGSTFTWLRSRQVGGRITIPGHGRQYYRMSPSELNPEDGVTPAWPISYSELDQWYTSVEETLGLKGAREELRYLPQSHVSEPIRPNPAESHLLDAIQTRWPGADVALSRYAAPPEFLTQDSTSESIDLRTGAVATRLLSGSDGAISGVEWYDHHTRATRVSSASKVFLCASAFESVRLMMASKSSSKPKGIGNSRDQLGKYIMDHILVRAEGTAGALEGEPISMADGRCIFLPRFDMRDLSAEDTNPGYGIQVYQSSGRPGHSYFTAAAFGEMLPRRENCLTLSETKVDRYGVPIALINCTHSDREKKLAARASKALRELVELAKVDVSHIDTEPAPPGLAAHECGGARMGTDPSSSVLDMNNECWDTPGLYVTDGSAFPSQGIPNPTLTIMALTARACAHASQASAITASSDQNEVSI